MSRAREIADRDLAATELILDADNDTSITADTDDQIDIRIAGADDFAFKANKFEVQSGSNIDMNGTELILDADGDTSITSDTDDQVDIKVAGSDLAHITSTYAKLRGATPLVFGENNSTGTYQSISGEVGANNLLLRSYQSLTFKNGTSGSSLTDGTTAFNIDANGIVTMPKQPCFRASVQNSTGSTVGATGNLTFNRENIDLNADYDTSNGRFTAPVDGTYYVSHAGLGASGGSGGVHTSNASWHVEFLLNGSRTFFQFYWYAGNTSGGDSQGQYVNAYMDMVITLSAGDYITVQLPDGTDSYYINPNSDGTYEPYFQGFLIG